MTQGFSILRMERLVEDAFRLQRVMAQSTRDTKLVEKGYKFHYLVDTEIFSLFGEPGRKRNCRMVSALPSLINFIERDHEVIETNDQDDDNDWGLIGDSFKGALFANALLTGEYIFKLAGQSSAGPVLVSPEHAGEIFLLVNAIERRSEHLLGTSSDDALEDVYSELKKKLEALTGADQPAAGEGKAWVASTVRSVVTLLAQASRSPLLPPHRLSTLFSGEAIANAANALRLPDEIVSPDPELIHDWRRRISIEKRANQISPSSYALDADAVTIAQLDLINRQLEPDKSVCVLITGDRGIHRAYQNWYREQRQTSKIPIFYAVRDPRQYAPILNINSMSGQYVEAEIFDRVKKLVRDFAVTFSSTDFVTAGEESDDPAIFPDPLTVRTQLRSQIVKHRNDLEPFSSPILQELLNINTAWVEAIEYSVAAKIDVISELADRQMLIWRRAQSKRLFTTEFFSHIDNVRSSFEELTTSTTLLRQELRAVVNGPRELSDKRPQSRRALASEFENYISPEFRGSNLEEILADIRQRKADAIPMLKAADRAERLFVTGCLSLQIGSWAGAKSLLDRAHASRHLSRQFAAEVELFRCMARRLAAPPRNQIREYAAIRRDLIKLEKGASAPRGLTDDPRVRNEQLAVDLCDLAFVDYRRESCIKLLESASLHWRRMSDRFGARLTEHTDIPYWRAVSRQFLLNTFNLLFWADLLGFDDIPALKDCAIGALEGIKAGRLTYVIVSNHGKLYPLQARHALATSGSKRAEVATQIADQIDQAVEYDERSGIAYDIPFTDKAEFAAILRRLAPDRRSSIEGIRRSLHPELQPLHQFKP